MAVHLIDLHRFAVYEAGAALLSVLAYPGDSEETRSGVHASLCHHALRNSYAKSSRIGRSFHSG